MEPFTALAIASTAAQAAGSIMQGNQQAAAYDQQAQASERNALVADMQARQAYAAGTQNELAQRRSASQQQAQVRAAVSESGFDAGSGTALAIQGQSARDLEMDALQTRYETLLQGYGHEQQGVMDRYTASTLRQSSRNAQQAGLLGAATSVLTGAASFYGARAGSQRNLGWLPGDRVSTSLRIVR